VSGLPHDPVLAEPTAGRLGRATILAICYTCLRLFRKPQYDFTVNDYEQRDILIPLELLGQLTACNEAPPTESGCTDREGNTEPRAPGHDQANGAPGRDRMRLVRALRRGGMQRVRDA
jgi:hypothetical protein